MLQLLLDLAKKMDTKTATRSGIKNSIEFLYCDLTKEEKERLEDALCILWDKE